MRTWIAPVLAATIWISISEFARNEFCLKSVWVDHYAAMGLSFPDAPLNGAIWGLWSLLVALGLRLIMLRFSLWETVGLSFLFVFILMWTVTGNMGVFPFQVLPYAIPLSLIELGVAAWLIAWISGQEVKQPQP